MRLCLLLSFLCIACLSWGQASDLEDLEALADNLEKKKFEDDGEETEDEKEPAEELKRYTRTAPIYLRLFISRFISQNRNKCFHSYFHNFSKCVSVCKSYLICRCRMLSRKLNSNFHRLRRMVTMGLNNNTTSVNNRRGLSGLQYWYKKFSRLAMVYHKGCFLQWSEHFVLTQCFVSQILINVC